MITKSPLLFGNPYERRAKEARFVASLRCQSLNLIPFQAILPLLLAPSLSHVSYALQALAPVAVLEPSAAALLHAIVCAVRWEAGMRELASIGGERWLVWAASTVCQIHSYGRSTYFDFCIGR